MAKGEPKVRLDWTGRGRKQWFTQDEAREAINNRDKDMKGWRMLEGLAGITLLVAATAPFWGPLP